MKHSRIKELETIIVLAFVMLGLSFLFKNSVFAYISFVIMLTSLFSKTVTSKLVSAWFRFAEVLGNLNSKIILSLVFFVFLTPIALLYRVFVKNPLGLKKSASESYYKTRNYLYSSIDLEKVW
jgi:hypothetical protein